MPPVQSPIFRPGRGSPSATRSGYLAALDWLYQFANFERQPSGHSFNLDRPRALLRAIGDPQRSYHSVVIAGTKGKGSTAAMLQALLRASGRRVGLYTQPHLHTFRERIRLGDRLIGERAFARGVKQLQPAVEAVQRAHPELGRLTSYEIGTALALWYFSVRRADWAVLEVGLGGRLDAVNAVRSALAILTPISLDHTEILGSTLAQIAAEKAGIIHPAARVVSAVQPAEARAVLQRVCQERQASLIEQSPADVTLLEVTSVAPGLPLEAMRGQPMLTFSVRGWEGAFTLRLGGAHQAQNAATALRAAESLDLDLSPEDARRVLAEVNWPGRLEVLGARPTLVVDGAHNGASAQSLAAAVQAHFQWDRMVLVLGTSADKDLGAILDPLLPLASTVIATQATSPRALAASSVAEQAAVRGVATHATASVAEALRAAETHAGPRDLVLVTGSLFVVAEAREHFGLGLRGP